VSTPPALSCKDVSVSAGARQILRSVALSCDEGEVVGVLGPSGAGKSTLFRAIAGETPLASGTVHLGDADVTREPLWRRAQLGLSYIPQSPSVLWDLTVRENLQVYARVVGGARSRDAGGGNDAKVEGVDATAERVGLSARLDVRAGALSGGERRRLEFARAITRAPRVMICDEPFAGVDPEGAERIGKLLEGLAKGGVCVLLADHHVAEALAICTRAVLLLDGKIAVEAAPEEFREHELVKGRYLGNWGRSLPPPPGPL
jgi:lipopolysaccharide export system ATP-binding protein